MYVHGLDHSHTHTHTKTRPTPSDLHSWFELTSSNTKVAPMLTEKRYLLS